MGAFTYLASSFYLFVGKRFLCAIIPIFDQPINHLVDDWLLLIFRVRMINCIWNNDLCRGRLSKQDLRSHTIQYVKDISIVVLIFVFSKITIVNSDSFSI